MKLPYGISNFRKLITENRYYVDRTSYIEKLENSDLSYVAFLRPRRFGKSLFVSMLQYYYGSDYRDQFDELFGKTYIGQRPTSEANSYKILKFDFSGIETATEEKTLSGFLNVVRSGVRTFLDKYSMLTPEWESDLKTFASPAELMGDFFERSRNESICLLVDEYDHFANEILSFRFDQFTKIVGRNGFVRKFYEAVKKATQDGTIQRLFITGVTPITLDSLTSGFNIVRNLTIEPDFHEMIGFTESETRNLLELQGFGKNDEGISIEELMEDVRRWYNGYRFEEDAQEKIYNPEMLLNFIWTFLQKNRHPKSMVAENVASDYGKIRKMFEIKSPEQNCQVLEELIQTGTVTSRLTTQYSFEKGFDRQDFVSLLFYLGFISIEKGDLDEIVFSIPNYVIHRLYWDYFVSLVQNRNELDVRVEDFQQCIKQLALENDVRPFAKLIASTLKALSNRDKVGFDEKYVKALFVAFLNLSDIYFIRSEREVDGRYPDIMLLFRKPFEPNFQFILELKYLKKKKAGELKAKSIEAQKQLQGYLASKEIKGMEKLKAWSVVFVGDEIGHLEEVN